jgi:hypothetical protein
MAFKFASYPTGLEFPDLDTLEFPRSDMPLVRAEGK